MLKKRKFYWFITVFVLALFVANYTIGHYFYSLVIERGPKDFLKGNKDLEVSAETLEHFLEGDWIAWTKEQPFEEWHMTSFDGLELIGYYLKAKEPSNKTVVFAHGYLGRAFDMGLFGQYYYEHLGFNLFTPDLRGHGKSEGEYYGFGWHDRLDLIDWIELLIEKEGENQEIILHGLSMGAAAVLMASGEQLPEQVKGIIADSAYTSVYDLFAYQIKRMFHLPPFPFLPTTSVITKQRANYTFEEASALEQVKKATVPVLLIHGGGDTFVPTEMSQELYDAIAVEKEIVIFPEANHGEAVVMHREKFLKTITAFVEKLIS
ncbi:MAG: alpha/beta fold hydrolase [Bacilli bacterium]|nr:alpha/beta fold hydrolase [Bacilli bacterium]